MHSYLSIFPDHSKYSIRRKICSLQCSKGYLSCSFSAVLLEARVLWWALTWSSSVTIATVAKPRPTAATAKGGHTSQRLSFDVPTWKSGEHWVSSKKPKYFLFKYAIIPDSCKRIILKKITKYFDGSMDRNDCASKIRLIMQSCTNHVRRLSFSQLLDNEKNHITGFVLWSISEKFPTYIT